MKIFVYDMLVNRNIAEAIGLQIEEEWIGEFRGQLWCLQSSYIALPLNHLKRKKGNNRVLGKIYQIKDNQFTIAKLDAFYACTMSKFNFNHSSDLYHRITNTVNVLNYTNAFDLANFTYSVSERIECEVYVGNILNERVIKGIVPAYQRNRINSGVSQNFIDFLRKSITR